MFFFFFQAEDGIRDHCVTGVQTCERKRGRQRMRKKNNIVERKCRNTYRYIDDLIDRKKGGEGEKKGKEGEKEPWKGRNPSGELMLDGRRKRKCILKPQSYVLKILFLMYCNFMHDLSYFDEKVTSYSLFIKETS